MFCGDINNTVSWTVFRRFLKTIQCFKNVSFRAQFITSSREIWWMINDATATSVWQQLNLDLGFS